MAVGGTGAKVESKLSDPELMETIDSKIERVYERLRNDNWLIWKESIKLAERQFSTEGIQSTMKFLPTVVYDRDDLKRTVNSLMLEGDTMPRAVVKVPRSDNPAPVALKRPAEKAPTTPVQQKPASSQP